MCRCTHKSLRAIYQARTGDPQIVEKSYLAGFALSFFGFRFSLWLF